MTWRKATWTILFSPILLGGLALIALGLICNLPRICCERQRAVRYLPYVGLVYYGLAVPLVLAAFGLGWWEVLFVAGLLALLGRWLLPDPLTYLMNPRKRRAAILAIEHVEAGHGPRPLYGRVNLVASETGRTIVSVCIKSDMIPSPLRFLAVADETASVEELDFGYVSSKHGIRAWF